MRGEAALEEINEEFFNFYSFLSYEGKVSTSLPHIGQLIFLFVSLTRGERLITAECIVYDLFLFVPLIRGERLTTL